MQFNWKQFAIALGLFLLGYLTFNGKLFAQTLEKPRVAIAVGGKNLLYYLPLTVAGQLGYFKDEGLQVEISDFAGGAKALQALIGGSTDARFVALHAQIWSVTRDEVLKGYQQQQKVA